MGVTVGKKSCFGILEEVFPVGKEGLRETVPGCLKCIDKKACLQAALSTKEGLAFRSEIIDRVPAKGLLDRLKRWSDRKRLSRLIQQESKK